MDFDFVNIEKTIGYTFKNSHLLLQAFTRKSYSQENGGQNNEVLEFIGDKVLDYIVTRILVRHYGVMTDDKRWKEFKLKNPSHFQTKSKEGIFTDIKKELVQKKSLARAIDNLGFAKFMYLGKGEDRNNLSDSVKEDLFEAILGAVAIDSSWNYDDLIYTTECMIDIHGFLENDFEDSNYVGSVQEWYLKQFGLLPSYDIGEYYDSFSCQLNISGHVFYGEGPNKAKARMDCARQAYDYLKQHGYIKDSIEDFIEDYDETNSIKTLNELFQKQLIEKPQYSFVDEHNGDSVLWKCNLSIKGINKKTKGSGYSKKEAQRTAALKMLDYICGC